MLQLVGFPCEAGAGGTGETVVHWVLHQDRALARLLPSLMLVKARMGCQARIIQGRAQPRAYRKEARMSKRFVGVDLGLHSFDVAVRPDRLHWVVPYTPEGVSEFVKRMPELRPQLVVMEACGNLERPLARALEQSAIPAAVMNPRQVRHYAKSTGRVAKTDKLDAEVLARFAEFVQPVPRPLPDEDAQRVP
jgi:hypothetical protein